MARRVKPQVDRFRWFDDGRRGDRRSRDDGGIRAVLTFAGSAEDRGRNQHLSRGERESRQLPRAFRRFRCRRMHVRTVGAAGSDRRPVRRLACGPLVFAVGRHRRSTRLEAGDDHEGILSGGGLRNLSPTPIAAARHAYSHLSEFVSSCCATRRARAKAPRCAWHVSVGEAATQNAVHCAATKWSNRRSREWKRTRSHPGRESLTSISWIDFAPRRSVRRRSTASSCIATRTICRTRSR